MDFKVYLQNNQPFVYKTFTNARKNNKLAQTYLVKGNVMISSEINETFDFMKHLTPIGNN